MAAASSSASSGRLWPADVPAGGEAFDPLAQAAGARVERIRSAPTDAPGPWYDQGWDEWVALLVGAADLTEGVADADAGANGAGEAAGATRTVALRAGDWVWLPAGRRHRVERVREPSVWLAVHFAPGARPESET